MHSPASAEIPDSLRLWYKRPAANWNEALPVGNGRLGAMVFGGIEEERLQLNEETIWSKGGEYKDNPNGHKYVDQVRELLFQGKYNQAEKMFKEKMMTTRLPSGTNTYQTLGDLSIKFEGMENITDYYRDLDLHKAISTTRYKSGNVQYTRTVFSSAVDQALIMKVTADATGKVDCSIELNRPGEGEVVTAQGNTLTMTQHLSDGKGVKFETRLQAISKSGTIKTKNNKLIVKNADELELRLVAGTDYFKGDPTEVCNDYQEKLAPREIFRNTERPHCRLPVLFQQGNHGNPSVSCRRVCYGREDRCPET